VANPFTFVAVEAALPD